MPTAIVVDGAFFIRRFRHCFPKLDSADPKSVASGLLLLASWHLASRYTHAPDGVHPSETNQLYRVFFYDCPPLSKKVHTPVHRRALDLSKTPTAIFRNELHRIVVRARKVTLRLGRLSDEFVWRPKPDAMRRWLSSQIFDPLDDDFELDVVQKGVDMRLGLDVASMAFKKQIDQIVIVAADADFVPAAKLARREGLDVVLDTMGAKAALDLVQHVDGIRSSYFDESYDIGSLFQ